MQTYTTDDNITLMNTAVTLGKFDGIHLGHQELIKQLICEEKKELSSVLFSFDTTQNQGGCSLTTFRERVLLCERFGIENLILYPVNEISMSMSAKDFIKQVLVEKLGAKTVVTGNDFRFGKDRQGNVDTLLQYKNKFGYSVITVPSKMYGNDKISSSRIKNAINEGKLKEAKEMLGFSYFLVGNVVKGRQLGRTIGIRTLNIEMAISKQLPPQGVYATTTIIDGIKYKSITNIGTCPTVTDSNKIVIETHVLNFEDEIYGKEVIIIFDFFVRNEIKFQNLTQLQKQISKDIKIINQ